MILLSVEKLSKHFEGVRALDDLDLSVEQGEIRGIIGPNGSGKTTFVNLVSGILPATRGRMLFQGDDITTLKSHVIVQRGIARTFQIPKILPEMSCLENVMLGRHCRNPFDLLGTWLRAPFARSEQEVEIRRKSMEVLAFIGLEAVTDRMGHELSWVEEQLLQICRALISDPRLLLLDEPTAGMGEAESKAVQEAIRRIQSRGVTTIVVAHDMNLISEISDRVTCLSFGTKIADGATRSVLNDPKVLEVYLGAE
jgi:branched-chain amino acid transport system ATP-binding protein